MEDDESFVVESPTGSHPFWRLPNGVTYNDRRRSSPVRRRVRRHRRARHKSDEDDDGCDIRASTKASTYTRPQSSATSQYQGCPTTSPLECPTRLTRVTESDGRGLSTSCGTMATTTTTPGDGLESRPPSSTVPDGASVLSFRPKRFPKREESTASLFENDVIMGPTRPNLRGRHKSPLRRIDSVCEKYVKAQLLAGRGDGTASHNGNHTPQKRSVSILKRPKTSNACFVSKTKSGFQHNRRVSLAPGILFSRTEQTKQICNDKIDDESEEEEKEEEPNRECQNQIQSRPNSNFGDLLSSPVAARDSEDELSKSFMELNSRNGRRDSFSSMSSEDLEDELNASKNSEEMCESDAFDTDCEPDVKSEFCQKDFIRSQTRADAEVGHMTYVKVCKESQTKPRDKIRKQLMSKKINLKHGGLLPPEARALSLALKINSRVEEVDISYNSLPADAMCGFLEVMTSKRTVTKLVIRGNRLDDEDCAKTGNELLNNNDWITYLDLSECVIGDSEIAMLAQGVQDNRYIHTLKLSKNKIGLTGALLLGRALGMNDTIKKLDLSWNQIRGAGAVAVCNCLKKNTSIEWLDLSWNGIGFEGSLALGEAIRINRRLKYLNLENNRINWDCAPYLTKALMGNRTLEVLLMGQNPISMEGCEDIIQALTRASSNVRTLSFAGIPINTRIALMATDIAKTREFSMDHGGVLTTNDVIGNHRATREDPFTLLIRYLSMMGIRVMDLFRMFDKDNKLLVTRAKFIQGLKRVRVPLDDDDILKVARRLQSNKRGCISYQELANTVRNRIREERLEDKRLEILTRKKREERKRILQSDKPLTASTNINFLPGLYSMFGQTPEKETQSGTFSSAMGFYNSRPGSTFTPTLPILKSSRLLAGGGKSAEGGGGGGRVKPLSAALLSRHGLVFNSKNNIVLSRSTSVSSNPKGVKEGYNSGGEASTSYVSQLKRQQSSRARDFMGTNRQV